MRLRRCCDVMTFESLTLTPFCMEILGVRKWIFQCFWWCFQCDFGWNQVKYTGIGPLSSFLHFFANIPFFFSRARSAPREGGTGKYRPPYQPPYQPSTYVLDGRFDLVDTAGPKVKYQGQY